MEFKDKVKMKSHMCRIHIDNPTCGDYYLKNWILSEGCTRIYSNSRKSLLVFLHSEECITNTNRCPDMISYYDREMINYDGVIFHAALNDYYYDGSVNWLELNGRFGIRT